MNGSGALICALPNTETASLRSKKGRKAEKTAPRPDEDSGSIIVATKIVANSATYLDCLYGLIFQVFRVVGYKL